MKQITLILFCCFALTGATLAQQVVSEKERGIELYRKGNHKEAVNVLRQVVKNHGDAQAWYYLGISYLQAGDRKNAQKALEKTIDLEPNNAQAHVGLAYVYLMKNDDSNAGVEARKALDADSQNHEAVYLSGVLSYRNGFYDSAYKSADKVIKINPNFANAYLLKSESLAQSFGVLYGAVNKSQSERADLLREAADNLEIYLKLAPDNRDAAEQRERLEGLKFLAKYYSEKDKENADASNNANTTPLEILSKPMPSFTESARQAGASGVIRISVLFAEDGRIRYAFVLKPLGYGLTEVALRAARAIKFKPATKNGKPVSLVKTVEYSFNIRS